MTVETQRYAERIADAHGVSGYTHLPDGSLVYAGYRDGDYDLVVGDEQLTDVDGDLTAPEYLEERETVLALRDTDGSERHDVVEVDPQTGSLSTVLDDEYLNVKVTGSPTDPDTVALVSNRDRSLDLYTLDLDEGTVTRRSETDEAVMGYAWAPDGDRMVYQAGTFDETSLRMVDLSEGTDETFIDEPNSEQSFAFTDDGNGAWSTEGIVFTTNHATGYRELAVAAPDGEYELYHITERDKYEPQWTDDGDVVYLESHGGDRTVRRLSDGEVTVIERTGLNLDLQTVDGDVHYTHRSPATAGAVRREGKTVVDEGSVDLQTVAPEDVTFESFDGRELSARLYRTEGEPIGGVVQAHGGPEAQHFNTLDPLTQTLVDAGFEVLAPDFRGSLGYGRDFRKASDADLGGDDLRDVVAAAEYLRERGRDTVGITGGSYGGYLTLLGLGATDAFDVGASVCGVVNWETTYENAREYLGGVVARKLGGSPDEKPDLYEERSPITYTDDIEVPLLVVQGANDPRVPESEAEQLVESLSERHVDHEYLRFEDEGHGVVRTDNRVEYITRTVEFFESAVRQSVAA